MVTNQSVYWQHAFFVEEYFPHALNVAFNPVYVLVRAFVNGPVSEKQAVLVNLDKFITLSEFCINLQQISTNLNSALYG